MHPNNNPFETAGPLFRELYHWSGQSAVLTSLLILGIGAVAMVGSLLGMALVLGFVDGHGWGPDAFAYVAVGLLGLVIASVLLPALARIIRQ